MKIAAYNYRDFDEAQFFTKFGQQYQVEILPIRETPTPENAKLAAGCDGVSVITTAVTEEILQETIAICNELEADPYRMDCGGLLFCNEGLRLCAELKGSGCGYATAVGYTTKDRKRLLYYDETERFLTRN